MLAASGEAASLNASAPATTTTDISDRAPRDVPESANAQAPEGKHRPEMECTTDVAQITISESESPAG